ncbi:iron chelate uptake ABC transporter family permease subunit, partial [Bartonella sp. CL29QHWL]|uniref:iron chelate uptake ABC transporter family permease subunit n=1 Tax=Bartonella sp. CL29QHWL TaxID=3243522 RepID=UPI0035CEACC7
LAIIGTVTGTFLSSVASAAAMFFQVSQTVSAWYNAKIHTVNPDMLWLSIPIGLAGLALATFLAKPVTIASLGEETAIGLGQRTLTV